MKISKLLQRILFKSKCEELSANEALTFTFEIKDICYLQKVILFDVFKN